MLPQAVRVAAGGLRCARASVCAGKGAGRPGPAHRCLPPAARGVPCDAPAPAGAAQLAALATRAALGQGAASQKYEARCARRRCCCASRLRTGAPAPGGPRLCRQRNGVCRQRPRCLCRADACERHASRERQLPRCCKHRTRLRCEHRFLLRLEHHPRCLSGRPPTAATAPTRAPSGERRSLEEGRGIQSPRRRRARSRSVVVSAAGRARRCARHQTSTPIASRANGPSHSSQVLSCIGGR